MLDFGQIFYMTCSLRGVLAHVAHRGVENWCNQEIFDLSLRAPAIRGHLKIIIIFSLYCGAVVIQSHLGKYGHQQIAII